MSSNLPYTPQSILDLANFGISWMLAHTSNYFHSPLPTNPQI